MDPIMLDEIGAKIEEVKTIAEEAKSAAGGYQLVRLNTVSFTGSRSINKLNPAQTIDLLDAKNVYLSEAMVYQQSSHYRLGATELEIRIKSDNYCSVTVRFRITLYSDSGAIVNSISVDVAPPTTVVDGGGKNTIYLPLYMKISRVVIQAFAKDYTIDPKYWACSCHTSMLGQTTAFQLK